MRRPDTSKFIVIGEGLAAGMTNFSLVEGDQKDSFPALLAARLGERFVQPLIQAPGIGDAPGFRKLPVRVPWDMQSTVLSKFPPAEPYANISLPGLTVAAALTRRPEIPVIRSDDFLQTSINLVLGLQDWIAGTASNPPSVLEYALRQKPTLAVLELGFAEVLEGAISGDPNSLPERSAFLADYATILKSLKAAGCDVIVLNIPDPMDTAYFSTLDSASRVLKLTPSGIRAAHGLQPGDRITVSGLMEMGYQTVSKKRAPLPKGSVLSGSIGAEISNRVRALNNDLAALVRECGATLYDLCGFFRNVRDHGAEVGSKKVTADFLGGFYSLNGYYPGKIGHALLANELVGLINRTFGSRYEPMDPEPLLMFDAVSAYQQPEGPMHKTLPGTLASAVSAAKHFAALANFGIELARRKSRRKELPAPPSRGCHPDRWKIKLPPGLEQTLPLNKESSYYGDALRAVHAQDAQQKVFGLTGNLLFGGLAMLDSHLSGSVRIKFSPPQNDITKFEISFGNGLVGDDERLSSPQFYCLPAMQHRVMTPPDGISSGELNLIDGVVTNLKCQFFFLNSAIFALAAVNPKLPKAPLQFPGFYGTTWARFDPRPDGLLDFTFYATTFIPLSVLGGPVRFPLPFVSPSGSFAHIPCDGTALHPHIHLSTKAPAPADPGVEVPEFPTNTVWEMMASIHNNTFGDDFLLNAPELGGHGTGRSHLHARYQIQFGGRIGDAVPVIVTSLPPGGLLADIPQSKLAEPFGSRIPRAVFGHTETLSFGSSDYKVDEVSMLDDPLDIAMGMLNLKTGKLVGELLHRGLISTTVFMALINIEPRTPKVTFTWRGPASFEKGVNGQVVFRYAGTQYLPYPEGLKFPSGNLKSYILIGPDSVLWPFLRHQAMLITGPQWIAKSGEGRLVSSNKEEFSYKYSIPAAREAPYFEYTNHTIGGTFRLECLTWLNYINSRTSKAAPGDFDTITFSGLGRWSKDPSGGVHIASVQICNSEQYPYVSILIDGGLASNVNTRPKDIAVTMP